MTHNFRGRQTQQFKHCQKTIRFDSREHFILRTHHNDSTFLLENFGHCGFLKSGLYCNFLAKRKENFWISTWGRTFCSPHFWTDAEIVGWLTSWGYWECSRRMEIVLSYISQKVCYMGLSCFLWKSLSYYWRKNREFNLKRSNFEYNLDSSTFCYQVNICVFFQIKKQCNLTLFNILNIKNEMKALKARLQAYRPN